jgi:hypothetical protein
MITVRNLPAEVKRRLRLRAAQHGHSMEAEARAILAEAVARPIDKTLREPDLPEGPFAHLVGRWKGRMTTDALMSLTRGDD